MSSRPSRPPRIPSVEVWTDAAVYERTGVVVLGWIVRVDGRAVESRGAVDASCAADSSLAELAAMRHGLESALAHGLQRANVVLYSDHQGSLSRIESLRAKLSSNGDGGADLSTYKSSSTKPSRIAFDTACAAVLALASKFRACRFVWVRREQNHAADWITRCYGKHADKRVRRRQAFADACAALDKIEAMSRQREQRYVNGEWQHSRWNE